MKTMAFLKSEDGAVVVDWMVLTASVVGLCLTVLLTLTAGMEDSSAELSDDIAAAADQANPG